MNRMMLVAAGLALTLGAANAASPIVSDVDNVQNPSPHAQSTPGTVGGMTRASSQVATGADEIKRQQEGGSLNGAPGLRQKGNTFLTRQSPGTVGASPGYTPGR